MKDRLSATSHRLGGRRPAASVLLAATLALAACASPGRVYLPFSLPTPGPKVDAQGNLIGTRNDPNYRENAPPAYFPNQKIPPKYPEAKPQTHGLDLSKHDIATAKAYFDWLCANEAGEFIYKTVEDANGLFEMRRRPDYDGDSKKLRDRYYLEDPWGWMTISRGIDRIDNEYSTVLPREIPTWRTLSPRMQQGDYARYRPENGIPLLERVSSPLDRQRYGDAPFIRYTRVWPTHPEYDRDAQGRIRLFQDRKYLNGPSKERLAETFGPNFFSPNRQRYDEWMLATGYIIPTVEPVRDIKSHYGFTWRGIERSPHDRELGIAGGEILIFDLRTNDVLAVRRNFIRSPAPSMFGTRNAFWDLSETCTSFEDGPLRRKVIHYPDPYKNLKIE